MTARSRLISVLTLLACGAVGVISATQTWFTVVLDDGAAEPLLVPGDGALALLTPLSLTALALGGALSIVGVVLRYVFGALTVVIAVLLGALTAGTAFATPISAVSASVTEATGITGTRAVGDLVASITPTPWPFITLVAWVVLAAGGILILVTARRWGSADRRYRAEGDAPARTAGADGARPADAARDTAIDSWDDLSRGEDPTADR